MAYSTINKSTAHFNTKLHSGDGNATRTITGVGFQPDMVWGKNRSSTGFSHLVWDAVRGTNLNLQPNATNGEENVTTAFGSGGIGTSASDGYTIVSGTSDSQNMNNNGNNFVSWNWKANGSGSSNTDGSITSTVSANTTSGFSIVKYTGTGSAATIGHGLGVVPKMIISKRLDTTNSWMVYHEALGNAHELYLNGNSASSSAANSWNSTTPTSSVWSVKNDANNTSGGSFISYAFAETTGFSKFSSFTGNASLDGPFCYTGFKPAFVIIKNTITASDWNIYDNRRSTSSGYNEVDYTIVANSNGAEDTSSAYNDIDMCSNGFKIREDNGDCNGSGQKLIYMAFGQPVISNSGVCATAR